MHSIAITPEDDAADYFVSAGEDGPDPAVVLVTHNEDRSRAMATFMSRNEARELAEALLITGAELSR